MKPIFGFIDLDTAKMKNIFFTTKIYGRKYYSYKFI